MQHQIGGTAKVKSEKAWVAYDVASGRVHRIHREITLEGGKESSESEMEVHLLGLLEKRGLRRDKVRLMPVDSQAIKPRTLYRVDVKNKSLVVHKQL
jgi:hypothetical protein